MKTFGNTLTAITILAQSAVIAQDVNYDGLWGNKVLTFCNCTVTGVCICKPGECDCINCPCKLKSSDPGFQQRFPTNQPVPSKDGDRTINVPQFRFDSQQPNNQYETPKFQQEPKRAVLYFGASWCAPCQTWTKQTLPLVQSKYQVGTDRYSQFRKFEITNQSHKNLAQLWKVQVVPTFIFLESPNNNPKEVQRLTGPVDQSVITAFLGGN